MGEKLTLKKVLTKSAGVATDIFVTIGVFYVGTTKLKTPAVPTAAVSYTAGYIAGQKVESLLNK